MVSTSRRYVLLNGGGGVLLSYPTVRAGYAAYSQCSTHQYCCRVVHCLVAWCVGGVRVMSICLWSLCGGVSCVCSPLTLVVGGGIADGGVA